MDHYLDFLYRYSQTDRVACVGEEGELSFRTLWERSDGIAKLLRKRYPTSKPVIVFGDKENDMVSCMLGAVKAGKTYIPIPSFYPLERIRAIVKMVNADVVLNPSKLEFPGNIDLISRNEIAEAVSLYDPREMVDYKSVPGDAVALLLFTSGSTGTPKGVEITYDNMVEKVALTMEFMAPSIDPAGCRAMNPSSYGFSASLSFVYCAMAVCGATLYSVPKAVLKDFSDFMAYIETVQPNIFLCTPTVAHNLLRFDTFTAEKIPSLCYICIGGEGGDQPLMKELMAKFPKANVLIGYGMTETVAAGSTYFAKPEDDFGEEPYFPVSSADNELVFLVDEAGNRITEENVVGELIIRGSVVAKGYYRDSAATEQKFFRLADGTRAYHTNDLGKIYQNCYFYVGRRDNQVKIGGNRVEIEDVEANLKQCALVAACGVAVCKAPENSLVAFVVLNEAGRKLTRMQAFIGIKKELMPKVNSYMIPAKMVFVESLPKNINNKLDRVKLTEMAQVR